MGKMPMSRRWARRNLQAAMEKMFGIAFFNPYLLWGLGGAAVPILIHLFNRRRFKTVAWAAMDFLLSSSKMTSRRLKILQALLLLTRMGIVSLLVLGLARPYMTGVFFGGALARSKSSAVIILDNSYSMGLREGNETNFDVAKEVAGNVVSSFERGDSLTYILMAASPEVLTEGNPSPKKVQSLIKNSELSDGRTDILSGLLKGTEILASEKNTRKELFLITDCQKSGWGVGNSGGWEKFNQFLSSAKVQPKIYLLDVSRQAAENVTVSSIELPAYPCGVGKKYMVEVGARSSLARGTGVPPVHGQDAHATKPVFTLFLDDEMKEVRRAEGSEFKDGVSRARLVFSADEPGIHWGKVEVPADSLEADNARYFIWEARRSVPILCVDGADSGDGFQSGIAYLAYAFAPEKQWHGRLARGRHGEDAHAVSSMGMERTQGMSNILDPKVISVEQFWEEDLGQYNIVVLSNVRTISGRMYEELSDFVRNGGGLMIFLGDNVDSVEYSERYGSAAKSFLPCAIGSTKGEFPGEGKFRISDFGFRISHSAFDNPQSTIHMGGDLSTARFYKFFSVDPDTSDPDVDVLAAFQDGSPYLVEKQFGRGKTILFTSSCDLKWSNLPLKPVFLPLVHRLAYYLVSGADERYKLTVGEKIVQRIESGAASVPASITDPAGARFKVLARGAEVQEGEKDDGGEPFVAFEKTSRAGIYTLRTAEDSREKLDEGQEEKIRYFAVNVDTEESDLSVLEQEAIERLIRWKEFRYLKAEDAAVKDIQHIRQGKEMWRFLIAGVLCFLVLESVVARQIDKG